MGGIYQWNLKILNTIGSVMKFLSSKAESSAFSSLALRILLVAALILFTAGSAAGQEAVVNRDGSLLFQEPDDESAVLDILSRGTKLQMLEQVGQWCKVLTSDSAQQGFVRRDAVRIGAVPPDMLEPSVEPGSEAYQNLQRELGKSEARLRQTQRVLENLERMLEKLEQADQAVPESGRESGMAKPVESGLNSHSFGFNVYSGLFFDDTDYTVGLSSLWSPEFIKPLGIEIEGGLTFLGDQQEAVYANLGLIFPFWIGWERINPYLAMGGGLIRRETGPLRLTETELNPLANLGAGILLNLKGSLDLRADLRSVVEFSKTEDKFDGRFYLGLSYLH